MDKQIYLAITLMMVSVGVFASFQNQLTLDYTNKDQKFGEVDEYALNYLYLFSPVQDSDVPYDEQIFISRPDLFIAKLSVANVSPDSFPFPSKKYEDNQYSFGGKYRFKGTPFYMGLRYQWADYGAGQGADGEAINLSLGYYLDLMSEISFSYAENRVEPLSTVLTDILYENKSYGLSIRKLFDVDDNYFSLSVYLRSEQNSVKGFPFYVSGFQSDSLSSQLFVHYFFNKATSVYSGITYSEYNVKGISQSNVFTDYVLGIKHYFEQSYFASISFSNLERIDTDSINLNIGYRF